MTARAGDSGFLLLEAIIAFAIAGGVTLGAATLYQGALGAFSRADAARATLAAAQSALARVGPDIPARPGERRLLDGAIGIDLQITPLDAQAPAALPEGAVGWRPIDPEQAAAFVLVRVTAQPLAGGRAVTLETFRAAPWEDF